MGFVVIIPYRDEGLEKNKVLCLECECMRGQRALSARSP